MNKIFLTLLVVFFLISFFLIGSLIILRTPKWVCLRRAGINEVAEVNQKKMEQISELELGKWIKLNDKFYIDEGYNFLVFIPPSLRNHGYAVKKEKEEDETIINFGLPVNDDSLAKWLSLEGKSEKVYRIWSIHIFPISLYEKRIKECELQEMCFVPKELARNERYVFGGGFVYIAGGWEPCDEEVEHKFPSFCEALHDSVNLPDGFLLLDFLKKTKDKE